MNKEQGADKFERHYDRAERIAMMPEALIKLKNRKKGFFRNNRSTAIILADIIIICILLIGFIIYSKISSNQYTYNNYNFLLKGYIFDSKALISLTAVNTLETASSSSEPKSFEATITCSGNNEFYKKMYEILPDTVRKDTTMRAAVQIDNYNPGEVYIVYALIRIDNTTIKLKYNLKKEK